MEYLACTHTEQDDPMFWSESVTLFSNLDHGTQAVTNPLSYEQCALKAVENDAPNITSKEYADRCSIKNTSAVLSFSDEGNTAYATNCT